MRHGANRPDPERELRKEPEERRRQIAEARLDLLRAAYPVNAGIPHSLDFPGERR